MTAFVRHPRAADPFLEYADEDADKESSGACAPAIPSANPPEDAYADADRYEDERPFCIAVLGAGALGSLYGGYLALAGCPTALISTNHRHMRAVAENGLVIEKQAEALLVRGLITVTDAPSLLRVPTFSHGPDLLLVCVKSVDTAEAAAAAVPLVRKDTVVLTLQNGLGNVETMSALLPVECITAGVSYCGAGLQAPGRVREAGKGKTIIGELDGAVTPRLLFLQRLFNRSGLPAETSRDVTGLIWTKLMANAGINAVAALRGIRNGEILEDPETLDLMQRAAAEAFAVARAKGITPAVPDVQEYVRRTVLDTCENYASMVQDVRAKRRTEVECINGAVAAEGKRLGIPTPVNEMLTERVLAMQSRYLS